MLSPLNTLNSIPASQHRRATAPASVDTLQALLAALLSSDNTNTTETDHYAPSQNALFPGGASPTPATSDVPGAPQVTTPSQAYPLFRNNRGVSSVFSNPAVTNTQQAFAGPSRTHQSRAVENSNPFQTPKSNTMNGQSVFRARMADANSFDTAQRLGNCGLVSMGNALLATKGWNFVKKVMNKFRTNDLETAFTKLGWKAGAASDGGSTRSTWAKMANMVGVAGKAGRATLNSIAKMLGTGRAVEMSVNANTFWGMGRGRGQDHAILGIGREKRDGKDGMWIVDSGKPNNGPKWYSMSHMARSLGGSRFSDIFVFKDKMANADALPKSLREKLFSRKTTGKTGEQKVAASSRAAENKTARRPVAKTAPASKPKTSTTKQSRTQKAAARNTRAQARTQRSAARSVKHAPSK